MLYIIDSKNEIKNRIPRKFYQKLNIVFVEKIETLLELDCTTSDDIIYVHTREGDTKISKKRVPKAGKLIGNVKNVNFETVLDLENDPLGIQKLYVMLGVPFDAGVELESDFYELIQPKLEKKQPKEDKIIPQEEKENKKENIKKEEKVNVTLQNELQTEKGPEPINKNEVSKPEKTKNNKSKYTAEERAAYRKRKEEEKANKRKEIEQREKNKEKTGNVLIAQLREKAAQGVTNIGVVSLQSEENKKEEPAKEPEVPTFLKKAKAVDTEVSEKTLDSNNEELNKETIAKDLSTNNEKTNKSNEVEYEVEEKDFDEFEIEDESENFEVVDESDEIEIEESEDEDEFEIEEEVEENSIIKKMLK